MIAPARALRVAAIGFLVGCSSAGPAAIAYGIDLCTFCHMPIGDGRFAAVVVNGHARSLKFDSIDCLLEYLAKAKAGDAASVWVADFSHPGTMLRADSARFVRVSPQRALMGRGWVALAAARDAAALGAGDAREVKRWSDVR